MPQRRYENVWNALGAGLEDMPRYGQALQQFQRGRQDLQLQQTRETRAGEAFDLNQRTRQQQYENAMFAGKTAREKEERLSDPAFARLRPYRDLGISPPSTVQGAMALNAASPGFVDVSTMVGLADYEKQQYLQKQQDRWKPSAPKWFNPMGGINTAYERDRFRAAEGEGYYGQEGAPPVPGRTERFLQNVNEQQFYTEGGGQPNFQQAYGGAIQRDVRDPSVTNQALLSAIQQNRPQDQPSDVGAEAHAMTTQKVQQEEQADIQAGGAPWSDEQRQQLYSVIFSQLLNMITSERTAGLPSVISGAASPVPQLGR